MLKETVDKVKKLNPQGFLAHIFIMGDDVRVGYYVDGKVATYIVTDKIETMPLDEILDKKQEVKELDLSKVKLEPDEALKKGKEAASEHYPLEMSSKWIVILANSGNPSYTITGVTMSLKSIVITIDAGTGKVINHSCEVLAAFDPHS
ncbi:MAG: hypothetical protein QF486_06365 [Candidatus Woesearchaeota archaeon]|jgi:hypothetical protein|nr:hypothetical protein [Candidatus Woesearchaeota archaeon]MDP7181895.1 hypothetical protein [Candidatus Woesearchaeota archaeon]MDP7199210.1 hypothetical protein [Candidatus Woesearchaeota archaeon]MDP7467823.1 hypothetical protein [Candidatus Woesearchaeota archaeon]MDP7647813.1 hypothetical protein [Candidatus Woesearchaeota archaeon]